MPAENIVTQGPQTLKDAATDFLRASLADHSEFRDLPDQWVGRGLIWSQALDREICLSLSLMQRLELYAGALLWYAIGASPIHCSL